MATIVTRIGKGSALTFEEGDANFTNLNTDKLEDITGESIGDLSDVDISSNTDGNVLTYNTSTGNLELQAPSGGIANLVEDTTPQLGGDLDLLGFDITDSTGFPSIGGIQYPKASSGGLTDNVSDVDDIRNPNTITLDGADVGGVTNNTRIQFSGSDVTSAGLSTGTDYYIAAQLGNDTFEISNTFSGSPITITDPGSITDFTYTAPDISSSANTGDVLTWNGSRLALTSPVPPPPASLASDPNPQLSNSLDVQNYEINTSIFDGDVVLAPNGSGKVVLSGIEYPNTNGTDGQVLTTNGSGTASWQDAAGGGGTSFAMFSITFALGEDVSNNQTFRNNISKVLDTDNIVTSNTTNQFTLPAGTYIFTSSGQQDFTNTSGQNVIWYIWNESTGNAIESYTSSVPNGTNAKVYRLSYEKVVTLGSTTNISLRTERALTYGNINTRDQHFKITKIA